MNKVTNKYISFTLLIILSGCFSINYDFKGGVNIAPHIKTFSVQYFENRARLVEPTFSQRFTDDLKVYIEGNTNLRIINGVGDVDFSGTITTYQITPQSIAAGDKAALTRFTIAIRLEYKDRKVPENDIEKSISAFREFESTKSFSQVEEALSQEIMEELHEQVFNAAFVNW